MNGEEDGKIENAKDQMMEEISQDAHMKGFIWIFIDNKGNVTVGSTLNVVRAITLINELGSYAH